MANTPVVYKYPTKPIVPTINDSTKNVQYIVLAYRLPISEQPTTEDLAYIGDMDLPFFLKSQQSVGFFNFNLGDHLRVVFLEATGRDPTIYWKTELTVALDVTPLSVPADKLKALRGRMAKIRYYVTAKAENGVKSVIRTSAAADFEVRGLDLPAPKILEAQENTLELDKLENKNEASGVTVTLEYSGMALDETVKIIRRGIKANATAVDYDDADFKVDSADRQAQSVTAKLPVTNYSPLIGGSLVVNYWVYRDNLWYPSEKSTFQVK
ncbi:hypothetical protein [Pseudomonas sp. LP_7_YM]|uniref:hypothetical protein n=1 Tax=Pseudomonas sp. LP_7_YM TaxID=2485137 RepID=UPI0010600D65|nr:hypothetical protein [Pseudomonas sp. LP_7_YM]TDV65944.1 hypothetical protein EC915_104226 [Pseudomonas sp. LP_7_YM]